MNNIALGFTLLITGLVLAAAAVMRTAGTTIAALAYGDTIMKPSPTYLVTASEPTSGVTSTANPKALTGTPAEITDAYSTYNSSSPLGS